MYVTTVNKLTDPGVFKKITYQKDSFSNEGFDTSLVYLEGENVILDGVVIGYESSSIFSKIMQRITYPKDVHKATLESHYDVFYIRKSFISLGFLIMLSNLKESGATIIVEIPTYPYRKELDGVVKQFFYIIEVLLAKKLKKYVDFITYYGDGPASIWGIPTLKLENGVDVDGIRFVDRVATPENKRDKVVNFIAVANLSKWHGYERLLEGIKNLEPIDRNKVLFHIVGSGSALQYLKNTVEKLELQDYVIFHGMKHGEQLDSLFEIADICVGSLGMYKLGLYNATTLKAREFCARGLPFVLGYNDCSFPNDCEFVYQVANDPTPINVKDLLVWYRTTNFSSQSIRTYALDNLTWKQQIHRVLRFRNNLSF